MRVLFLDVDGVLNRSGFRPDRSVSLRSWIEPELVAHLNAVTDSTGAQIVMSSDWRVHRALPLLREELVAAGVTGTLIGTTPVLGNVARWREVEAWLTTERVDAAQIAIVDDGFDMGPLAHRFARASPLNGLDADVAAALIALLR